MEYSCFKDKEFQEAWTDLDEIYRADFNTTGTGEAIQDDKFVGPLYHFYEDLADLLNSLKNKIIYSTKNDLAENPAQFDFSYADKEGDGSSYVCMTNTLAGKNYMVNKFRRPFGLSFKADSLNAMLKKHTIKTYSAFSTKGDYTSVSKTKNKDGSFKVKKHPTLLAASTDYGANPFSIYAVGQLEDNLFFISGGQGVDKLWPAQTFSDVELYKELKAWFMKNIEAGEEYQKRMYYHFRDAKVLNGQEQMFKNKPITAGYNLNTQYRPRADKQLVQGEIAYNATIAFNFSGTYAESFKEVLGYGPINVIDEHGKKLLALTYVDSHVKGGYRGPLLYGRNLDDEHQPFAAESEPFTTSSKITHTPDDEDIKSTQWHLKASEKMFKKLAAIFNEYEYRIYLADSRDFRFELTDIESIVLPEVLRLPKFKEVINLRKIIYNLEHGVQIDYSNSVELKRNYIVVSETIMKAQEVDKLDDVAMTRKFNSVEISPYAKTLVQTLVQILSQPVFEGTKVSCEFVPNTPKVLADMIKTQATLTPSLGSDDTESEQTTFSKKQNQYMTYADHERKILYRSILPLEEIEQVPGQNGEQTVLAPVPLTSDGRIKLSKARLGSEVILVAEDASKTKYVLFVYKSKSPNFMELPGGGFMTPPQQASDYEQLLIDKLAFKCNIKRGDLLDLTDTGNALLLSEKGVAKDKDVTWDWSYYRLFTAKYKHELSGEDLATLSYTHDNTADAEEKTKTSGMHVNGYRAHMRWVPVDSLKITRPITDRYADLIPAIIQYAKSL
jgi:hypothetical protein